MDKGPWESNSLWDTQDTSRFLWNTKLAAIFTNGSLWTVPGCAWLRQTIVIFPPRGLKITLWKSVWNLCWRIWHRDRTVSEYFGINLWYLHTNYQFLFHSLTTERTSIRNWEFIPSLSATIFPYLPANPEPDETSFDIRHFMFWFIFIIFYVLFPVVFHMLIKTIFEYHHYNINIDKLLTKIV